MSETTFRDRLPDYHNQYGRLKSKTAWGNFLTRLCKAFGFERKYLTKLLNGTRTYRPARTYAKPFSGSARPASAGCPDAIRRRGHGTGTAAPTPTMVSSHLNNGGGDGVSVSFLFD